MKYLITFIVISASVIVLFVTKGTNSLNNEFRQEQDASIKEEIIKTVDSINFFIKSNDVNHGIACGDKGSWSDISNTNNERLKTQSDLLISNGILLINKYYKFEKVILAEIIFTNRKDTIYWEDRYFDKKGFYNELHTGDLDDLSDDLSTHIKTYHYKRD